MRKRYAHWLASSRSAGPLSTGSETVPTPTHFRVALSHRYVALEADTARLWIQDPGRGEVILQPGEVTAMRPVRQQSAYGIAVHTAEGNEVWFAPFFENIQRASYRQIVVVDHFVCALEAACRKAAAGILRQPATATLPLEA